MIELRTCAKRVRGLAVTTLPQARNQEGRSPPKIFFAPLEKCVRQFKKIGPLSENSLPYMVSQAGNGPALP